MSMIGAQVKPQDRAMSMVEALILVIVWLTIYRVSLLVLLVRRLDEHRARSR